MNKAAVGMKMIPGTLEDIMSVRGKTKINPKMKTIYIQDWEGLDGSYHITVYSDLTYNLETPHGITDGKFDETGYSHYAKYQEPDIEQWINNTVGPEVIKYSPKKKDWETYRNPKGKKNPMPVKDILEDIDIELNRLQDAITEGNLVDINKYEYGLWALVSTLKKDEWRGTSQHERLQKLLDKSSFYKKNPKEYDSEGFTTHKAQSDYKCYICGKTIKKGTKYKAKEQISYGWKGRKRYHATLKKHMKCKSKPKKNPMSVKDILKDIDIELDRLQDAITEGNLVDINKYEYGLWALVGTLKKSEWRGTPQHEKLQKLLDKSSFYKKNPKQNYIIEHILKAQKKQATPKKTNPNLKIHYLAKSHPNFLGTICGHKLPRISGLPYTTKTKKKVTCKRCKELIKGRKNPLVGEKYMTKDRDTESHTERQWKANPKKLTDSVAHAAAWDEANRHMKKAGRKEWSKADYNVAVRTYNKLMKKNPKHKLFVISTPSNKWIYAGKIPKNLLGKTFDTPKAAIDFAKSKKHKAEVHPGYKYKLNPRKSKKNTIVVITWRGTVDKVTGLPKGWDYEIIDLDTEDDPEDKPKWYQKALQDRWGFEPKKVSKTVSVVVRDGLPEAYHLPKGYDWHHQMPKEFRTNPLIAEKYTEKAGDTETATERQWKNPRKPKYYKMAKEYCGKPSKIYHIKQKKFPYKLEYTINVMYDESVSGGIPTCIVDVLVGGTYPAYIFVFVEDKKGKWIPAPELLRKLHINPNHGFYQIFKHGKLFVQPFYTKPKAQEFLKEYLTSELDKKPTTKDFKPYNIEFKKFKTGAAINPKGYWQTFERGKPIGEPLDTKEQATDWVTTFLLEETGRMPMGKDYDPYTFKYVKGSKPKGNVWFGHKIAHSKAAIRGHERRKCKSKSKSKSKPKTNLDIEDYEHTTPDTHRLTSRTYKEKPKDTYLKSIREKHVIKAKPKENIISALMMMTKKRGKQPKANLKNKTYTAPNLTEAKSFAKDLIKFGYDAVNRRDKTVTWKEPATNAPGIKSEKYITRTPGEEKEVEREWLEKNPLTHSEMSDLFGEVYAITKKYFPKSISKKKEYSFLDEVQRLFLGFKQPTTNPLTYPEMSNLFNKVYAIAKKYLPKNISKKKEISYLSEIQRLFEGAKMPITNIKLKGKHKENPRIKELWFVLNPTPHSILVDIVFKSDIKRLALQFKGGLKPERIVGVYTAKPEAEAHGKKLLKSRKNPAKHKKIGDYEIIISETMGTRGFERGVTVLKKGKLVSMNKVPKHILKEIKKMSKKNPYKTTYVPAELFLKHKGVSVYHVYKDDEFDQGPTTYSFVLDKSEGEDESFDVRDLPGWKEAPHPPYLTGKGDTPKNRKAWDKYHAENVLGKHIKKFIKGAIDKKHITSKTVKRKSKANPKGYWVIYERGGKLFSDSKIDTKAQALDHLTTEFLEEFGRIPEGKDYDKYTLKYIKAKKKAKPRARPKKKKKSTRPPKEFWDKVYPEVERYYKKRYPKTFKKRAQAATASIWHHKISPKKKAIFEYLRTHREQLALKARRCPKCDWKLKDKGMEQTNVGKRKVWQCPKCKKYYANK